MLLIIYISCFFPTVSQIYTFFTKKSSLSSTFFTQLAHKNSKKRHPNLAKWPHRITLKAPSTHISQENHSRRKNFCNFFAKNLHRSRNHCNFALAKREKPRDADPNKRCGSSAWLEYMPVTHGVASSSLVRTAVERGMSNLDFGLVAHFFRPIHSARPACHL